MPSDDFETLVREALSAHREGWDFAFLQGRTTGGALPWSYGQLARTQISCSARLLDQDTGGGEVLASLAPLPAHSVATEPWEPNVPVARKRLAQIGVEVRYQPGDRIPASAGEFDLVLNRHGQVNAPELSRVLSAGGQFLTQQVGRGNDDEFNHALAVRTESADWPTLDRLVQSLSQNGFQVTRAEHAAVPVTYQDIGAIVFQLLTVSWQVSQFTLERFQDQLRNLHRKIRQDGGFTVHDQRYLVAAFKP